MTWRQRQIVAFFLRFARAHGKWPTMREVAQGLGISSSNGVRTHLVALRKKGMMYKSGSGTHSTWGVAGYKFQLVKDEPC